MKTQYYYTNKIYLTNCKAQSVLFCVIFKTDNVIARFVCDVAIQNLYYLKYTYKL